MSLSFAAPASGQDDPPTETPAIGKPVEHEGVKVEVVSGWEMTAAGPFGSARRGDLVLRNSEVALFFAAPEAAPKRRGMMLPEPEAADEGNARRPGALIDVLAGDGRVDFMAWLAQGIGSDPAEPNVKYDAVEVVRREANEVNGRPAALGLQFTGRTDDAATTQAQVRTTWYLSAGEPVALIETELLSPQEEWKVADIGDWGAGAVISDAETSDEGGTGATAEVQWMAAAGGDQVVGYLNEEGATNALFYRSTTRFGATPAEGEAWRRWLLFGTDQYSNVTDRLFAHPAYAEETARVSGSVEGMNEDATDAPWVDVLAYDRDDPQSAQWILTRTPIRPDGTYEVTVPAGSYFMGTQSPARRLAVAQGGIRVAANENVTKDLIMLPTSHLNVKVIDADTSEPMAARVQFLPIPPTPQRQFHTIDSPRGYLSNFYVGREGATVAVHEGKWALTATRGIEYDLGETEIETALEETSEVTIALKKSSPAPGWQSMEAGALTLATPGAAMTAEETVLMAAGEGLDWVVSGDWETITNLRPAIESLELESEMGASRGFRTRLPQRPELGDFLIYPVASEAPDPGEAKTEWAETTDTSEFLATIRRLYPGALIEALEPFSETDGYFYIAGKNPYSMAYHMRDDVDPAIDAINVLPDREPVNFRFAKDFYFVHTLRDRWYLPVPVSRARTPLRSEPGYPRMLVRTGIENVGELDEATLFKALKDRKWQVTSGPFIEFEVLDQEPGAMFASPSQVTGRIRVTAPNWVETAMVDITKEGMMSKRDGTKGATEGDPLRYDSSFRMELYPQYKGGADTLLSVIVQGAELTEKGLPRYGEPGMPAVAFTSPIIADTNENETWDPPLFREKGK